MKGRQTTGDKAWKREDEKNVDRKVVETLLKRGKKIKDQTENNKKKFNHKKNKTGRVRLETAEYDIT